jgi:UDP-N-acetylmuramoylalanine--D-glutamate ligase
VTTSTNIFLSIFKNQVIGITGSKGKSTTSALIFQLLKVQYPDTLLVGNIGHPALDFVSDINRKSKIVMELSSHQLEDSRYSPAVAVILRLFPEHLDYYTDYQSYINAKMKIFGMQSQTDKLLVNKDDTELMRLTQNAKSETIYFSPDYFDATLAWIQDGKLKVKTHNIISELMPTYDLPLKGRGNLENILAAVNISLIEGVPPDKIKMALAGFSALPHRMEFVGRFKGIDFYNDSLATAPEAVIHALEALGESVQTVILGGLERGLDQKKLTDYLLSHSRIQTLLLFPDTGITIGKVLANSTISNSKKIFYVKDMDEAVKIAYVHTGKERLYIVTGSCKFQSVC